MTRLTSERLGAPARRLEDARRRAVDELAGRTVWFATALTGSREAARSLLERFDRAGSGEVSVGRVEVSAGEPLGGLGDRLWAGGAPLGAADRELCAGGVDSSEALMGDAVSVDDVVVLEDPLTALLARAVRERGAHAVWHVTATAPLETMELLRAYTSCLDAYLMAAPGWVAALMPSADLMSARRLSARAAPVRDVGWSSVLADVVQADRAETVGGRHHARPAIPVR
jgi:hypothetical protein